MKLSICIVNYKTKDVTLRSIASIYKYFKGEDFEIILLDNTPDQNIFKEDIKQYKEIKLYHNFRNTYFSGGFNQAISYATGEYVLVMSSDIILLDDSVSLMLELITTRPDIGAAEGTLLNSRNNEVTPTGSRELTRFRDLVRSHNILKAIFKKTYRDYSYAGWDRMDSREVEVITNAFTIFRRDVLISIQGFEEAMKLYFTEERMSDMLRAKGLKIWHHGIARVEHYESASTGSCSSKWIKALYKSDKKLYFALKNGIR